VRAARSTRQLGLASIQISIVATVMATVLGLDVLDDQLDLRPALITNLVQIKRQRVGISSSSRRAESDAVP